jgi:uncharacterized protein with NRDE domain
MCTLALAIGADRRFPVVVAANRDERLGRPAEGWSLREPPGGGPRVAAPRDLVAGGTWIGVSERGLVAALTNYHAPHAWYPDPARRSRGELPHRALAAPALGAARAALSALDPARWNPFHLVVASAEGGLLLWHDGEASGLEPLGPGLHVVTENARDGRCPRAELVRARWPLDASPARLREVLAVHAPAGAGPGLATCIHLDPVYGTRSAAILRLGRDLASSELLAADGPPCTAPLEDRSALLAALARGRA